MGKLHKYLSDCELFHRIFYPFSYLYVVRELVSSQISCAFLRCLVVFYVVLWLYVMRKI